MHARRYVAIVDDDESLCRSMSRLLEQAGLHPISFASAEEYLADPLRSHFGGLLVDIQLRGMSGIELHRHLRSQGVHTPVIYVTAYDDPAVKAEAMSAGCAGFFRKTDPGVDIIAAIRRVATV